MHNRDRQLSRLCILWFRVMVPVESTLSAGAPPMKQQRTTATVVRGLLRSKRDNRLAFVFRMRANFPIYRRKWSLPGGKVEPGQTPVEALIGELSKEMGVKVTPKNVDLVHRMVRAAHDDVCERIDLFYRIN